LYLLLNPSVKFDAGERGRKVHAHDVR
jgi:hypothetical protein